MTTNTTYRYINYPPLAAVPGLQFRHWHSKADFALALEIFNAERKMNGLDYTFKLEDFEEEVNFYDNFDINEQYIFAEYNGKAIAQFSFNWERQSDGLCVVYLDRTLLPEFYQEAIAQCILDYAEEKMKEQVALLPAEWPKAFRIYQRLKNQQAVDFYQKNGYTPVRHFFRMSRPIDLPLADHPLPKGFEIRPVEPSHYRAVWDAALEAFREHYGFVEPQEIHYETWQKDSTFQPHLWKIAWDVEKNEVAGMVRNFHKPEEDAEFNRKRGYTENIGVRPAYRSKGIAKALIAESIRMFKEMGMEETFLNVDASNPSGALKLYQSMGYEELPAMTSASFQKAI